jgi:uncharacterized protein (TIGR00369 family)
VTRAEVPVEPAAPYGGTPEQWREYSDALPASHAMGLRCTEIVPGRASFAVDDSVWALNPAGAVHGGLVAAIADQCLGMVTMTVVGDGQKPATATMTVEYQRPAIAPLTVEAEVTKAGRTLAFVTVLVREARGEVCTKVTGTSVVDGTSRRLAPR